MKPYRSAQDPGESARQTPGPCSHETPRTPRGRETPCLHTPTARPSRAQVHRPPAPPHRPPRLYDPSLRKRGDGGEGAEGRGRPTVRPPEGARGGVARRKDARGGAAVGEGSPARFTHRLDLLPARAPRRYPLRLSTARVSSRGSASSRDARGCGEVGASGGRAASGAETVGRMGRSHSPLPPRGHHRHGLGRLLSATEAAGPPTTPASRPPHHATPAGGVTAMLTNQRPHGGQEPGLKGGRGREGYKGGERGGGTSCD
ncbi:unnamed protein product [Rangifer tarandus platyrhynchus]|uniref:Uncharacterized protein n=1 Tax=Rangifer tarandus platyrhynchus TaxID=3082113 RepID=A0ABN8YWF9_RANTA|nr:unnamed protein product [Rangifer tarandus platyrhynchus]